jgi:hypothetical protein
MATAPQHLQIASDKKYSANGLTRTKNTVLPRIHLIAILNRWTSATQEPVKDLFLALQKRGYETSSEAVTIIRWRRGPNWKSVPGWYGVRE